MKLLDNDDSDKIEIFASTRYLLVNRYPFFSLETGANDYKAGPSNYHNDNIAGETIPVSSRSKGMVTGMRALRDS